MMAKRVDYSRHVKVGDFQEIVQKEINQYVKEIQQSIPDAVERAGKKCVQSIRAYAVMAGIPDREYAKSWKVKVLDKTSFGAFIVVHSPKKYRIAHLLEHGHVVRAHGRVVGTAPAYPHLIYAEGETILFLQHLLERIAEGKES